MSSSSPTTKFPDQRSGFTLLELIVIVLVGVIVLGGFTSFYLDQQRTIRRNEIEIETSQALRAALEQMERDLRSAGRDLLNTPASYDVITYGDASRIDFQTDSNDDGTPEAKEFRRNGANNTLEICTAANASCEVLAELHHVAYDAVLQWQCNDGVRRDGTACHTDHQSKGHRPCRRNVDRQSWCHHRFTGHSDRVHQRATTKQEMYVRYRRLSDICERKT